MEIGEIALRRGIREFGKVNQTRNVSRQLEKYERPTLSTHRLVGCSRQEENRFQFYGQRWGGQKQIAENSVRAAKQRAGGVTRLLYCRAPTRTRH
jgi:hypothetical protein